MWRRLGLARMMALIVVLAVGLAAMKSATAGLSRVVVYSAVLALLVSTVAAILRHGRGRSAWVGSVVFGWGYALFVLPIPHLNGGRNTSSERDDLTDPWRVDGPALELATFIHPRLAEPTDPDPDGNVRFDAVTGRGTRNSAGVEVPLTADEVKIHTTYNARVESFRDRLRLIERAQIIALTIQGVAFALAGAAVGRACSEKPASPRDSQAHEPESREA